MSATVDRLSAALTGRYRLERELGQGGMATVYLAEDLKHDRKVALKVLRRELAAIIGAERFLTEIRTTANLQHPHILPLFDSGSADGTVFYAMPFVEGESLRDRLGREKQLPIADAIRIATEVASALDYAHRRGVIHRDIKPENILLHDGSALVADFGIALAASRSEGASRMTETGMSLGTPHYMSPEQAMGERDLDARTDVYALGCMLYEMLAGETPFTGPSAQAVIAKVLSSEPEPITTLRRMVPPHVAHAVHVAIQKLPADRFETAARFAEALADPDVGGRRSTRSAAPLPLTANRPALIFAGLAALATGAALWSGLRVAAASHGGEVARFALALPAGQELVTPGGSRIAFAPDGRSFVYTGPGTSRPRLWLRRLDELEAVPIPGSEGATNPSFSPDASEIAFVTLTPFRLRVVSVGDGQARTVLDEGLSGGGQTWSTDGYIYLDGNSGLARVRPDGTDYRIVIPLDAAAGEIGVAWPSALPDARGVLARVRRADDAPPDYSIVVLDLQSGSRKQLVRGLVARYSPTGHLVWVTADGSLKAQRFDLDRLELAGAPVTLWGGVAIGGFGAVDLALSAAGDLVYTTGGVSSSFGDLVWVARDGAITRVDDTTEDGLIGSLALSPDGSAVAMDILRTSGDGSGLRRIWVKRLRGGPTELVTSEMSNSRNPVWTPDGRDVLYSTLGGEVVMRRRADGSGTPEPVLREPRGVEELATSPDGATILLRGGADGSGRGDLLHFRVGTDSAPLPLLATSAQEEGPALSPDGRWLAHSSDESGRQQVYVRPFPDVDSRRVQVSVDGGAEPRWSAAGDELFYLSAAGEMMSARVRAAPTLEVSRVDRLFDASGFLSNGLRPIFDPSPDGQRFLMVDVGAPGRGEAAGRMVVVQNFAAELARRVPR